MKIVIAGGTGFIGRHVCQLLNHHGHSVILLSRYTSHEKHRTNIHTQHLQWDGRTQGSWVQECESADVVINLSGAPIANSRWTAKRKQELIDSRVQSTKTLLQAISSWSTKPHSFITASGIGFYGNQGSKTIDEASPRGDGFLANLCQAWEGAAMEGKTLGLRVIPIRIGMVLGPDGGALSKMTLPFSMFLGGPILPGTQFVSWIHHEDLAQLIMFLITKPSIQGPVNAVAPNPITMKDFCLALGKALKRPSWLPVPTFVLKTVLGELSTMLTTGQRVMPQQMLQNGFPFAYPTLSTALDKIFPKNSNMKD